MADDDDVLDVEDDVSDVLSELLLIRSINCLATESDDDALALLLDDLPCDWPPGGGPPGGGPP